MVTYTVYKITCLPNNKFYIGYTKKDIKIRLQEHFKYAANIKNKHTKFTRAILKYGRINFKIEPIFSTTEKGDALLKEIHFIKEYNSINAGYNTTEGGSGGVTSINRIISDKTRKLISLNHADVSGKKNPFFNKKHSKETKKKIANRQYKKGSNHHFYGKKTKTSFKEGKEHPKSQPIIINGVEYGSLTLAAKAFGTYRQKIKELYFNQ
jgi:group I intron endonuclease